MYRRHGVPVYVYANSAAASPRRAWRWLFYGPLLLFTLYVFLTGLAGQTPLSRDYDDSILLEDRAACLTETAELQASMERFLTRTGIAPSVITVMDASWKDRYQSLEAYAYDLYVNSFRDEKHWLIVYSQPEGADARDADWSWEGMQGDDTGLLLTSSCSRSFGRALQKGLTREDVPVSRALSEAFDSTAELMMRPTIHDADTILTDLAIIAVLMLLALHRTGTATLWRSRRQLPRGAVPCPEPGDSGASAFAQAQVCAYCGCVFPDGSVKCPSCGAARPAES